MSEWHCEACGKVAKTRDDDVPNARMSIRFRKYPAGWLLRCNRDDDCIVAVCSEKCAADENESEMRTAQPTCKHTGCYNAGNLTFKCSDCGASGTYVVGDGFTADKVQST